MSRRLGSRLQVLEQVPATAARLLAQQAQAKLDAGVPVEHLSDAELEAVWESIPMEERAEVTALLRNMTNAEFDTFIADLRAG